MSTENGIFPIPIMQMIADYLDNSYIFKCLNSKYRRCIKVTRLVCCGNRYIELHDIFETVVDLTLRQVFDVNLNVFTKLRFLQMTSCDDISIVGNDLKVLTLTACSNIIGLSNQKNIETIDIYGSINITICCPSLKRLEIIRSTNIKYIQRLSRHILKLDYFRLEYSDKCIFGVEIIANIARIHLTPTQRLNTAFSLTAQCINVCKSSIVINVNNLKHLVLCKNCVFSSSDILSLFEKYMHLNVTATIEGKISDIPISDLHNHFKK